MQDYLTVVIKQAIKWCLFVNNNVLVHPPEYGNISREIYYFLLELISL